MTSDTITAPNRTHGTPYDRGRADSYYRRNPRPHKWTDMLGRNEVDDLNPTEIAEYHAGYSDNEHNGDHKDWGRDDYDGDDSDDE